MTRRWQLVLAAAFLCVAAASTHARKRKDDPELRAATLLHEWQYEEARAIIDEIHRDRPDAVESRYLRAEMDFVDGRYDRVLTGLDGITDDAIDGNVGALRALATSTYQVTKGFQKARSAQGNFEIYYEPGKDEAIVELTGEVLEAAYAALADDLGHKPKAPIRVELLGSPSLLAKVSTLTESEIENTGTIALCKYGKLMVVSPRATIFGYPWMDTLTHEYVHYVVTQMSAGTVPVWLHEGLARYLQVRWRGPATGALSAVDEHLLAQALRQRSLIDFDDMHPSMAKLPSQEAAALAFAEVHTMIAFVHAKVGDPGLRQVLLAQKRGKSARKAVAEIMETTWENLEKDWRNHLKSARLKTSSTVAQRTSRIRFKKGKSDDENVGIEAVKNANARKHTRLAGMLRARRNSAAAAIEYEKALAITGERDPFVAGKLSRTYLELGRFDEAIALAEPLLALEDVDALPPTTVGVAYLAQGQPEKAGPALEAALRISPFDPTVRCSLAEVYEKQNDERMAREQKACETLR